MKKTISVALILALLFSVLILSVNAVSVATPTASTVLVNGKSVAFEAYNISGSNYFKLRDLAKALNGSDKQFDVGWDTAKNAISLIPGRAYSSVGGELTPSGKTGPQSAVLSTAQVYINGAQANLAAYNIGGNNYFKLRDIGSSINFDIGWDGTANTITINTFFDYAPELKNLVVHFLDVGQADSEFIELPDGKTMLIDAGNEDNGPQIVKYINALGYTKLDYLIATHPHADHIGGMAYVVNNLSVGELFMPKVTTTTQTYIDLLTTIQKKGLTINKADSDVALIVSQWVKAAFLAPNGEQYNDLNNYSAVLRLTYGSNTFLFMGDAEQLSENEITTSVKADVLKVGHHGSTSSTGDAFLKKVSPKYAVISVGAGNDYGHPAQSTLDKLKAIGATTYRTDKDGTVVFTSDGTSITVNKSGSSTASASTPSSSPSDGANGAAETDYKVSITKVDKVGELVTIKNNGITDVDMTGWVLVSVTGNQKYTFPSYTLKAGAMVTVASGKASGNLKWTTSNIWNNDSSDPGELYDASGNLISTYGS